MIEGYLTSKQAGVKSGVSQAHIRLLMETGKLQGMKVGRDWLVATASLEYYMANRPKRGPKRRESASSSCEEIICEKTP